MLVCRVIGQSIQPANFHEDVLAIRNLLQLNFPFVFNDWRRFFSSLDSEAKMDAFAVKILPFLLIVGLITSQVVDGTPLHKKNKNGKIRNCVYI